MKRGYIKTYRSLLDWEWFDDWKVLKVFLHLTLSCNYEEKDWKGIIIKPGQIVTSYSILSREINLSVREIRTAINKLKTTGEVTSEATSKYTVFTVQNWEKFQEEDKPNDKRTTSETTSEETSEATSEATSKYTVFTVQNLGKVSRRRQAKRQTNDKRRQETTTKEVKNNKNNNNNNNNTYTDPVGDVNFEAFWNCYPKRNGKKIGKKKTEQMFMKLSNQNKDRILIAVENYAKSGQMPKTLKGSLEMITGWIG